MAFIEIMLSEKEPNGSFKQIRVPIEEADSLPKENVIFVILSSETTEIDGRRKVGDTWYRRWYEMSETDVVALIKRTWQGKIQYLLQGWDEQEWLFKDAEDPFRDYSGEAHGIPPIWPTDTILFHGRGLNAGDWFNAKKQAMVKMH